MNGNNYCKFHGMVGHHIEDCEEFHQEVKRMLTFGMLRMEGRKPEEEDIVIPPIHVSFPKSAYVMKPENMMEVLGQKLAFMDINNVDKGEGKGWNSNDGPKTAKEDELLPQLTVHSLEEAPTNAFV